MLKKITTLLAGASLFWAAAAFPVDAPEGVDLIREAFPGLKADEVHQTPVPGWYEIMLGSQVAYISSDAKYVMRGDLIELATNTNYTENRRNQARLSVLGQMTEDSAITFSPDKVKHSITVFTDVDCGYCRKLHSEIAQLEGLGVEVKYLFFPRAGPGSNSWQKATSVWCADDRNDAMTSAKAGQPIEPKTCEAPIQEQYNMGRQVGLRGTPAIVTDTGELISGYLPAQQLVTRLQQGAAAAKIASASE